MTYINKTLSVVALIIFLSGIISPLATHAQTNSECIGKYCALESLPGVTTQNQPVDLANYLTNIIKLTIGLAAALTVIMIIVGGFQYISTDAMSGKSEGKQRIMNALAGLALALFSYAILYTLGGDKLTNFNLSVEAIPDKSAQVAFTAVNNGGNSVCIANQEDFPNETFVNGKMKCSCPDCTNTHDIAFKVGVEQFMNSGLLDKLLILQRKAIKTIGVGEVQRQEFVEWAITEAWKPTVPHVDLCHYNGTCVDLNLTKNKYTGGTPSRATVEDINTMYKAAQEAGLKMIFEVNQANFDALKKAGVNPGVLHLLYKTTTAPSFHVE
ncbi:MAG: hypothetical protein WA051_00710 [Minisyncoccia bacterium]